MAPTDTAMPGELAPPPHPPRETSNRSSSAASTGRLQVDDSIASLRSTGAASSFRARIGLAGMARRTLGLGLLLLTVVLWTVSNFLASSIFSDKSYDKPFFVVYVNTSIFAISLLPMSIQYVTQHGISGTQSILSSIWRQRRVVLNGNVPLKTQEDEADDAAGERLLFEHSTSGDRDGTEDTNDDDNDDDDLDVVDLSESDKPAEKLSLRDTAWLSLEFCMLWFFANYFASACLQFTSVGSVTILTSTSSVWTLIFCAIMRVEGFTIRKLIGVLASLTGVVLISTVDLTGESDENRGNFPHKSKADIAIGDSMAFFSAIIYGVYVTVMKRRVGNEERVNMQLFFGLVGLFNLVLLWPLFFVLHFTGVEPFEMPPTGRIWLIILTNSISSYISDISWAYALLLTTPLITTVGLSLTIPLSLVGEMIQYEQYSSWIYWVGAGVVLLSFLFINHESGEEGDAPDISRSMAA